MVSGLSNTDLALHVARELALAGVREVCLCAGARNSPLVVLFSRMEGFRIFNFFEERSAAFFALGRVKAENRPVAVVTTSGTAAAELLPAAIEAHYAGIPLLFVTADRPRRYRGTGAPQAIEQKGLFGPYASPAIDIEGAERDGLSTWTRRAPAHLNVCFNEPLLDREARSSELVRPAAREFQKLGAASEQVLTDARNAIGDFLSTVSRPLVIVGGMEEGAREHVKRFLLELGAPVYLEATSGLRGCGELQGLSILSTDRIFVRLPRMKAPVNGILRIGGVPTLRFWRDLEDGRSDLPVLSVSDVPFSGMTRSRLVVGSLDEIFEGLRARPVEHEAFADLMSWDRELSRGLSALLEREPLSEAGMIHALSCRIAEGGAARIYLGNSLPIREWDLAAVRGTSAWTIGANRGANGIDGQISTFYGFCREAVPNWAVIGDLTALYDLSAPWILSQLCATGGLDARLVIVNNGGGKIFSRMFENPAFQNRHSIGFASWSAMWSLPYEVWDRIPAALGDRGPRVIELRPCAEATARFWSAYDSLCR